MNTPLTLPLPHPFAANMALSLSLCREQLDAATASAGRHDLERLYEHLDELACQAGTARRMAFVEQSRQEALRQLL